MQPDGPSCGCGNRGCWEVLASNRAALRYYFESGAEARGGEFAFKDLLCLAEAGDILAKRALRKMAVQIGRGTRMVVAGLAPEAILFVGEFTALWSRFEPVIRAEVQAQSISSEPTVLLAAKDGAMARVRGTIALVLQKHFGMPMPGALSVELPLKDRLRAIGRKGRETHDARISRPSHTPEKTSVVVS